MAVRYGSDDAHLRYMDDLLTTCGAIGRAEFVLQHATHLPDAERLVRLAEVIADLRRDLDILDPRKILGKSTDGNQS